VGFWRERGRPAALVAAGIVLTSAGHYLTPPELALWHNIFQRLYYLPIVYAAISFGFRGGLAGAALSGVCCLLTWVHGSHDPINQYAEIVVFLLVGAITGVLADRERRRAAELRAAADELGRVNRELQESFEQIKRADRLSAVGQLSAGLAHEIRNPLASIEGAAEIVDERSSAEEIREFRGIILKECRRLNRLLTSLLDFARPRTPELREVDVGKVFDSVIELWSATAGKSGVAVRKEIQPGLPRIECDPEQLTQVVLNLVINATQAMPEGGEVVMSARQHDARIRIDVRDQGGGIPEENLERIFNPFFTTKDEGTGLGLSVVHQIVTQHGGRVIVERNQNRGMTFSLEFPRHGKGKAA
jgi:signal transduction histidine kinase